MFFQGNVRKYFDIQSGWDQSAQLVPDFDNQSQQSLMKSGLEIDNPLDETQNGPQQVSLFPDHSGNTIIT